jgi:hypothetical protein
MPGPLRVSEPTARFFFGNDMTSTKTLLVAALLSTVAAVSFAQTPATPKAVAATTPAAATVPADAASKPAHHKHHAKKAAVATPAAPAASAAK